MSESMSDQVSNEGLILTIGPLQIFDTIIISWGIILLLWLLVWLFTRHLEIKPSAVQTAIEGVVSTFENAVSSIAPQHARQLLPFIGSLWIFLVIANLSGLIPGIHSPTSDLSATSALACLVFLSVHWFGIRSQGVKNYLRHYLKPSPILLPFHIIGEITRTIALAIRLFGNMMSLEMAALLMLMVAGFLVPVPIMMLHIIEALVQAYLFGLLALIYIAGGLQAHQIKQQKEEKNL